MKGLSVVFTVLLLVLAHWLAQHLKQTGVLPAENRPSADFMALTPAGTPGHPLPAGTILSL